jgi:regulator of protease activity HflC (stomatin/prohibitin superfamily)
MKNFFLLAIMLIAAVVLSSCGTMVPAGHVGVKVYLLGKSKGVDAETLGVGRYWIGMNEQLFLFPIYVQQYRFTKGSKDGDSVNDEAFYFQNKDGVKCNLDLSIQAHADPQKVTILFQKFREDLQTVMKVNLRTLILNKIQAYASALSLEELYGPQKVEMIKKVGDEITAEVAPWGIVIDNVSLLSDIRFPPEVEQAIVAKIQATQEAMQRENEVAKAKADAEIKVLNARAEAQAIQMKQQSITPTMVQYEAVMKWDGKLPEYMMGSSVPFININK